jgi:hypothetical protein
MLSAVPLAQAQQLRAKIVSQDAYDLTGYKQLLDDLRGLSASQEVCSVYEELVAAFPTAVSTTGSSCSDNSTGSHGSVRNNSLQLRNSTSCVAGGPWYMNITSYKQLSLKAAQFNWRDTPSAKCCAQCSQQTGRTCKQSH